MSREIEKHILEFFRHLDIELKESPFKKSVTSLNEYQHIIGKKRTELTLEDLDAEYKDLSIQRAFSSKAIAYYLPSILLNLVNKYYQFERHSYLTIFVPPVNNMGVVRKSWLEAGFVAFLTSEEKKSTATVLNFILEKYEDQHARDALNRYWNCHLTNQRF